MLLYATGHSETRAVELNEHVHVHVRDNIHVIMLVMTSSAMESKTLFVCTTHVVTTVSSFVDAV